MPHVPLPDEGGVVARLLQVLGEVHRARRNRVVVVHDPMAVGVEPGEDRGSGRRAERGRDERILEVDALPSQGVEVRRLEEGVHEAQGVVAVIVGEDEDQVHGLAARHLLERRRIDGGEGRRRDGEEQQERLRSCAEPATRQSMHACLPLDHGASNGEILRRSFERGAPQHDGRRSASHTIAGTATRAFFSMASWAARQARAEPAASSGPHARGTPVRIEAQKPEISSW